MLQERHLGKVVINSIYYIIHGNMEVFYIDQRVKASRVPPGRSVVLRPHIGGGLRSPSDFLFWTSDHSEVGI